MNKNTRIKLNDGLTMPVVALGVWQSHEGTKNAVLTALKNGYRHIDTAAVYHNEKAVGEAIKESGIPRNEIFVTTKLWNDDVRSGNTREALKKSLENLGLDYVDLYLIHWPVPSTFRDEYIAMNAETWRAMETLYNEGKCKAIGISNFKVHHIEELMQTAKIKPMVNQLEFHPGCGVALKEDIEYCEKHEIVVTGYSPLANGRIFDFPEIKEIADKIGVSVSQLCMRYAQQKNVIPIFKSVHKERILENINLDFTISDDDMKTIDLLKEPGLLNDSDHTTFGEDTPPVF